jgi:hypothetical protein
VVLLVAYAQIAAEIDRGGAASPYRLALGLHVVKNAAFFGLGGFLPMRYWELQEIWAGAGGGGAFLRELVRAPEFAVPILLGALAIVTALARGSRDVRGGFLWIAVAALPFLFLPGSGERFLYLPSFGACLVLGVAARGALARVRTGRGRVLVDAGIALVAAVFVAGSHDRQADWITAGRWTRGIAGRAPYFESIDPELAIVFERVPERHGSAWVFRNGFDAMARLYWKGRVAHREEDRPDAPEDLRLGVVLHPGGSVGMMPAHLLPSPEEDPDGMSQP